MAKKTSLPGTTRSGKSGSRGGRSVSKSALITSEYGSKPSSDAVITSEDTTDPSTESTVCAQPVTDTVTVPVPALDPDPYEIPEFLRRTADDAYADFRDILRRDAGLGGDVSNPAATKEIDREPSCRKLYPLTERDVEVIKQLTESEKLSGKQKSETSRAERRARKDEEEAIKKEALLKARAEYLKTANVKDWSNEGLPRRPDEGL